MDRLGEAWQGVAGKVRRGIGMDWKGVAGLARIVAGKAGRGRAWHGIFLGGGLATAGDVIGALARKYNPPSRPREWATLTELTDGAQKRRVDFLAINLWLSRGRAVHGFEIKTQRPDWIRELRQPKADSWFAICDQWSIVAPQGVVLDSEVPQGWGYVEILAGPKGVWRAKTKIEPAKLTPVELTPWWLIQRVLARADEREQVASPGDAALAEKWHEGHRVGSESAEAHMKLREQAVERAQEQFRELQMKLGQFTPDEVARACLVLTGGSMRFRGGQIARELRTAADQIDAALRNAGPNGGSS